MSENRKPQRAFIVILSAAAAVAACSKRPADAIAAGEEAQSAAVSAGAEEYAPDAMNVVAQAKSALDAELTVQDGHSALRRSYKEAEQLAAAYKKAADDAAAAATVAKAQAKEDANTLIAETRSALDEAVALLAVAPVGKGSRADVAAMRTDLETARAGLTDADASLNADRYLEAKSKAAAAREIIDRVKASVAQAETMRRSS